MSIFLFITQCRLTFKIGDVPACLIKQCEALQAGWNVGEENRTKGVPGHKPTPDCGFPNPRAARTGSAALIVCYMKLLCI